MDEGFGHTPDTQRVSLEFRRRPLWRARGLLVGGALAVVAAANPRTAGAQAAGQPGQAGQQIPPPRPRSEAEKARLRQRLPSNGGARSTHSLPATRSSPLTKRPGTSLCRKL